MSNENTPTTTDSQPAVGGPVERQVRPGAEARDREQAAFEVWLAATCPSGDVTEVQRQWETSSALQDFMEAEADRECDVPPLGWRCTRARGHEGPCAAIAAPDDVAFVERGMARLREAERLS